MTYVGYYDEHSEDVDMSVYVPPTEPPTSKPVLNQKGLPNAMRMYGKTDGATKEAGILLKGLNFSDVSFDTTGRKNGILGSDSYGAKLEGNAGWSNGSQGIAGKAYTTAEHHSIKPPDSAIDLFASGAEVVAIPVTYKSEGGKLRIASYGVASVETAQQKMELMGLKDSDRSTEFSYGAGVAALVDLSRLTFSSAVEYRQYDEVDGDLFGDTDAIHSQSGIKVRLTDVFGLRGAVGWDKFTRDWNEEAFSYEAGPTVDFGLVSFSVGVRGDDVDAEAYAYDSTRGYARLDLVSKGWGISLQADSDGDEHRGYLGIGYNFAGSGSAITSDPLLY